MNFEDFLELKKDIIVDEIKQLGLNYTFENFRQLLLDEIDNLSKVMTSSELTRDKVTHILKTYKRRTLLDTSTSRFVRRWLIRICKKEKAFNYALIHLQIDANRDPENYPVINIEPLSDDEIEDAIFEYRTKELKQNSFDNNDKTNPLILEIETLQHLHREFNGYLWWPIDYGEFINGFRLNAKKIERKDGISNSAFCYLMEKIEKKQTAISNFSDWMMFHIGGNNYGRLKNEFIDMAKNAKDKRRNFSLTVKQEKALEIKAEIDIRLKRIQLE